MAVNDKKINRRNFAAQQQRSVFIISYTQGSFNHPVPVGWYNLGDDGGKSAAN